MNKDALTTEGGKAAIWDIIVIGGGPAGMMAAARAAKRAADEDRNIRILLLEKNDSLGKKLLITGGGRCNVTNAETDNRALLSKFKDDGKFLFSAFSQHSVTETLEFFHSHGMQTKVEEGRRVFPVSDSSRSVWNTLLACLEGDDRAGRNPVTVRSNCAVTGFVQTKPGIIDGAKVKNGEIIRGHSFILATGGTSHPETGSTGDGFDWLAKVGHTIVKPTSALVPIRVSDAWVKAISGTTLADAKITIFQNDVKQSVSKGKVLFTHFGLSGPAILNMSSEVGELMKYGSVVLSLDLLPEHDFATLNVALQQLFTAEAKKKFKNAITALIPAAFVPIILEKSGIHGDVPCNDITREERISLMKLLKDLRIHPTSLLGADKAIVTSGGVALSEVDFRTMRSRLISNLYLVGDVLNIDRPSGGYSLQICWTTGWVAGNSAI